jgi:peptide/nickel transport system permease protein
MLSYILRRIVLMIPTLIGMTLLLFALVRFAPGLTGGGSYGGDSGSRGSQSRAAAEMALKKRLHLVDNAGNSISLPMQYIYWLRDTLKGDLGESVQYNTSVAQLIRERLPVTLTMNLISTLLIYLIAIPGGMLASVRRGQSFDVGWSFLTLAMFSLPVIWVGDMLLGFFANSRFLGWFPAAGIHSTDTQWMTSFQYATDYIWHTVLPIICLTYGSLAFMSKLQRASMLDNLGLDYVRTARAKGLSPATVVMRHVFRNSLLPMITLSAGVIPGLLSGAIVVEAIFSIKGMGDLMLTATSGRDLPIVQSVALIASVITVICLLITDICYMIADPRVSYE